MTDDANDIRPLDSAETDSVAGGLASRLPIMTTLAVGEEDGGGWATTLAVGEEDGGRFPRLLDAKFHLRQGA